VALPETSVQLYTLAAEFSADMSGSLDKLAAIGLRNVEAFDFVRRPVEIRAALDASGLASPTGHAPLLSDELWTPDGSIPTPAPEVVFEAAAKLGMTTVIDPFVAPERWFTLDGVTEIADRLNALADTAAGFGCVAHLPDGAESFTTIELKSNHVGTAREGTVACVARLVHGGRTTQVWDATVSHVETGKVIAHYRATQLILYPRG
jgi:hypothetical protein